MSRDTEYPIQHDEFIQFKTGKGNVKLMKQGPSAGLYRILSGTFKGIEGEQIRSVDQDHNVIVYVHAQRGAK